MIDRDNNILTSRLEARLSRERRARLEAEAIAERVTRELYEAHEKLIAAQRRLVQQERLSALGTMAGTVAHDFGSLLQPITGYLDILLSSPEIMKNPEEAQQYLRPMQMAANDAQNLVNRLRRLYQQEDGSEPARPVSINQIVEDSIKLTEVRRIEAEASKGVKIRVAKELRAVPPVLGSESQLREALINLLNNAFDAMPKGGEVRVESLQEGLFAMVEVRDTGMGMPPEVLERCFEPFYTTKGEHGTGLGLAIVYSNIKRHGGVLRCPARQGWGRRL